MGGNFLKSKEVKNTGWLIGEQVFQMLLSLIVGILSARYLGPSNYGTLNYTLSFVTFFTSIATLGMDSIVIKKMVETPEKEGEILGSGIFLRFLSSTLSTIAIGLLVFVLNVSEPLKVGLALIQSGQLIFRSFHLFESWFQRYSKSKYVSIGKMVAGLLVSAYKIFLLVTAKDIVWFAFSNVLLEGLSIPLFWAFYKKEKGQKLSVNLSTGKDILSQSYHFILSGLMVAVYGQMDKIMIGGMMTDGDVGLYSTAIYICALWTFVPISIINSFQPKIFELKKEGKEKEYMDSLKRLYGAVIWLCLVVSVLVTIFADFGVYVLYGEAYAGASGALKVAIWSEAFSIIGVARGVWVVSEGKQRYVKWLLLCGAVTNLVLNFILIPVMGIYGAALATVVTQLVANVIAPLFFKGTREFTKIIIKSFLLMPFWKKREKTADVTVRDEAKK